MKLLLLALLPLLAIGEKQFRKEIICQNEKRRLSCPYGESLSIGKAFYGRTDAFTCPGATVKSTKCQANDSMSVVEHECNGENACDIEASNKLFGDPCKGTSKYLEIQYLCKRTSGWPKVVICEGNIAHIGCNRGEVIQIIKAFYGRQDRRTCIHPSMKDKRCRALGSGVKISLLCNRRRSCKISASNLMFGNPCRRTHKYVEVLYKCQKRPDRDPCTDDEGNPISTGPFEKPGDCKNFYQCSNGELHTMPCAEGTAFNPEIGVCDWPHNVEGCT